MSQLTSADSPVEFHIPEHLLENTSEWMVERMTMELHLNNARQAMRALDVVELFVEQATNVMAELDWQQRNTDRFPFGPLPETKRLAIIISQKEHCADKRLIEALEKQQSRTVRSIILEHERHAFVELWQAFHLFAVTMFELLNGAGLSPEDLAAERSLVLRLEALKQQGIVPSYDHYGLEQHFDLTWRRARTYPARTRLPAPSANEADKRPAYALSRTRCHMYSNSALRRMRGDGAANSEPAQGLDIEGVTHDDADDDPFIDDGDDDDDEPAQPKPVVSSTMMATQQFIGVGINNLTPVAAVVAQDPEPAASSMGQHAMATAAVVFLEPRVFHLLQLNAAEGALLEGTSCSSFRGIRYWLNTTKSYGLVLGVMVRWFWGAEKRQPQWLPIVNSETSWLEWLKRHKADGTPGEMTEVARALKNALGINRYELSRTSAARVRPPMAKLLSHAEYCSAEGDAATPLQGDGPSFGKVAASGRSASLLNADWILRCNYGATKHEPPTGYVLSAFVHVVHQHQVNVPCVWRHSTVLNDVQ